MHHKRHGPSPLATPGGPGGATPYAPNIIPPAAYPWWKYGLLVGSPRGLGRGRRKATRMFYFFLLVCVVATLVPVLLILVHALI